MADVVTAMWGMLPESWRRWRVINLVEVGDQVPEHLPRKGVIFVGKPSEPSWIDCPCDEGHRVMLNLNTRRNPSWLLKQVKPITLLPSIDQERGDKRCHYFITRGRIQWVSNNQEGD
jgi:hypothetical protein